jgi:hypothetical protein
VCKKKRLKIKDAATTYVGSSSAILQRGSFVKRIDCGFEEMSLEKNTRWGKCLEKNIFRGLSLKLLSYQHESCSRLSYK